MQSHEKRAIETGELLNTKNKKVPGDFSNTFNPHEEGKVYHLLAPICVLIITTVSSMVITGAKASDGNITIFTIFAYTDVNLSLFIGGLLAVGTSLDQKSTRLNSS